MWVQNLPFPSVGFLSAFRISSRTSQENYCYSVTVPPLFFFPSFLFFFLFLANVNNIFQDSKVDTQFLKFNEFKVSGGELRIR